MSFGKTFMSPREHPVAIWVCGVRGWWGSHAMVCVEHVGGAAQGSRRAKPRPGKRNEQTHVGYQPMQLPDLVVP